MKIGQQEKGPISFKRRKGEARKKGARERPDLENGFAKVFFFRIFLSREQWGNGAKSGNYDFKTAVTF